MPAPLSTPERLAARTAQRERAAAHLANTARELAPIAIASAVNSATAPAFERLRQAPAASTYAPVPNCPGVLARRHATGDALRLLLPAHEAGIIEGFEAARALGASARQLSTELLSFNRDAPFMHGALASFAVLCAPQKDRDWLTLRGTALPGVASEVASVRVAGPCVVDGVTHLAVDVDYRSVDAWHGLTKADVISSAALKDIVVEPSRVTRALAAPAVEMLSDPVFRAAFDEMMASYETFRAQRSQLVWGGCTMQSYLSSHSGSSYGSQRSTTMWLQLGSGRPVEEPPKATGGKQDVYHPLRVLEVLEDPRVPFLDRLGLLRSPCLQASLGGSFRRDPEGGVVLDWETMDAVGERVGLPPFCKTLAHALVFYVDDVVDGTAR